MSCFVCPVCKTKLFVSGKSYCCENCHSFDISKEGYVNLLMSQQSSLKRHGDDKMMVRARRDFLNKDFYLKLKNELCETVKHYVPNGGCIVDVGCGEGYYTKDIFSCGNYDLSGIDISKEALKYAAKLVKGASFAVASAFSLPFGDNEVDCIINVFAPSAYDEFSRVLRKNGFLIKVVPLQEHLWDLKCAVYNEPYKNKPEIRNEELFNLVCEKELKYSISLDSNDDIINLFKMTPYYYKTGREEMQRLYEKDHLETVVHFGIEVYEKR